MDLHTALPLILLNGPIDGPSIKARGTWTMSLAQPAPQSTRLHAEDGP